MKTLSIPAARLRSVALSVFFLAHSISSVFASDPIHDPVYQLHIAKTTQPPKIDGNLDEPAWQTADVARNFRLAFPVDTGFSKIPTEVRMTFDDKNLYFSATCWQDRKSYIVQSLKRDFPAGTSDVINLLINPFKDGLNGFLFSVSPLNVQREALVSGGSEMAFEWDNKWISAVQNFEDRWTVEIAIPFKTLRYKVSPGENSWQINFIRTKLQNWEVSTWHPVPQQYSPNNVAFSGTLLWDTPPPPAGANVTLIPYVTTGYSIDYQRNDHYKIVDKPGKFTKGIGGDAKIAITPSLNLDLTVNPDFSQVEVDRQVANLSRFELFFPERRQFFLENRDLFALFGFPDTRPFFSRRIGIAANPITGQSERVPILAGARLSGKINDNWRIGLLSMQTERVNWDSTQVLPSSNFTVATLQRKIFGRSTISGIFVDKENLLGKLNDVQKQGIQPWNRVAGLEYNLYSRDNRWEGEWYYHRSLSPDAKQRGASFAHFLSYNVRHYSLFLGYVNVDSNYTADAGYVPRTGTQSLFPGASIRFYPKQKYVTDWGFRVNGDLVYNLKFSPTDRDVSFYYFADMRDQSGFDIGVFNDYTFLFDPFDPTNLDHTKLPANTGYTYSGIRADYFSSTSYNLQGQLSLNIGQFFNGNNVSAEGTVSYRLQPYGVFAMDYSFHHIRLPAPYATADFWLLGPRAELSFSRSLFASVFVQYNTQANNFNINARLQWRFAPVSDLFLVYTDNSFAQSIPNTSVRFFAPQNKAIVLKALYWLNL